ncbi:hypothetical protein GCM10023257_56970 [Streptomyces hyderabadensis]|uniref:NAD-dependent epimerase/dehydratase domain-containing protein n=1 Tax=Streptomyces hyderabadensis TaxID=598549 RepID=A0ABP9INM9_9ACTN
MADRWRGAYGRRMTRAVVIGATGQIGRAAVGALARDGWEVTAVSRGGDRDAR